MVIKVTTLHHNSFATQVPSGRDPSAPTFIDLFCGCGGFALGMIRSGFRCLAAIDVDTAAIATLRENLVDRQNVGLPAVENALARNLRTLKANQLAELIGTKDVDVIVGGPPCQGFSTARQRDGANHGEDRLVRDARRHLYRVFLRYVDYFRPKVFVIENVLGIRTAAGGEYFTRVQKESRSLGYRVHSQIEDAWELGVPQKRRRQLIVGVQAELHGFFPPELLASPRVQPRTKLGIAIGDLPILRAGGGEQECEYKVERRSQHLRKYGKKARDYLFNVLEIGQAVKLTNHVARPHSERDLRDFARLREGESSARAIRERKVKFEFPYDKSSFKDRYTRQNRRAACSTIVAHMSKDGLMFIHPTQNRSLTPREAARIQTFPDWFRFPVARTHAFRLIGNAVPPVVGEAVGLAIKKFLTTQTTPIVRTAARPRVEAIGSNGMRSNLPRDSRDAIQRLLLVARFDRRKLRLMTTEEFVGAWHALLFLFPGIHPDGALDHGDDVQRVAIKMPKSPRFRRLVARRYARSGWPIALKDVGAEAWRRYKARELSDEDFYCVDAQRSGLEHIRAGYSRRHKASAA